MTIGSVENSINNSQNEINEDFQVRYLFDMH